MIIGDLVNVVICKFYNDICVVTPEFYERYNNFNKTYQKIKDDVAYVATQNDKFFETSSKNIIIWNGEQHELLDVNKSYVGVDQFINIHVITTKDDLFK